jgi:hypothetical protein
MKAVTATKRSTVIGSKHSNRPRVFAVKRLPNLTPYWNAPVTVDSLECALDGGQLASWELTGAAGLSEDESHGQAPHP